MVQKAGNWDPVDVKLLVNNVSLVFRRRDIEKLNQRSYRFVTGKMSFIAHYNNDGFKAEYRELILFARCLLRGEWGVDDGFNSKQAALWQKDHVFELHFGKLYCQSVAEAIRGIVAVAEKFLKDEVEASLVS